MTTPSMPPVDTAARKALVTSAEGQAALAAASASDGGAVAWLARLVLLAGVPFQHLVPASGMLPMESLRVFQVDPNWIDAAIDGALSIGIASSADMAYQDAVITGIRAAARTAAGLPANQSAMSGFLLRSALVAETPDLVSGASDANGALTNLALTRPAEDILFGLYAGTLTTLTLSQPQTGLSFGFVPGADGNGLAVQTRSLTGAAPGAVIENGLLPAAPYVDAQGVVALSALAGALQTQLQGSQGLPPGGTLNSGGFALQMVSAPQSKPFTVTWPA